jgi:chromosome condensin MukBEF MukE localization factor
LNRGVEPFELGSEFTLAVLVHNTKFSNTSVLLKGCPKFGVHYTIHRFILKFMHDLKYLYRRMEVKFNLPPFFYYLF